MELLIDEADAPRVCRYRWSVTRHRHTWYAHATINGRTTYLHRYVLDVGHGDTRLVDHRNGNGLDCRRTNLRVANDQQNSSNIRRAKRSSSGYIGVYPIARSTKWMVTVRDGSQRVYLGAYDDPVQAARVYDAYVRQKVGAFAKTNFPEVSDE
jgi:hypothetical protein